MTVRMKWDNSAIEAIKRRTMQGLIMAGYDVANRARTKAPVLTGNLAASIRVEPRSSEYCVYIRAGGVGGIKYARRREYENNLHPSTKHYMANSLREVTSGNWQAKYLGGVA